MSLGVRGFNPIWSEVDLQGNLFDDTFWLFVLSNTIPYIPVDVYHDPDLSTRWTNPIQFLGNGTLPVDIFFNPNLVYRLEFRQGPDQSYPLIYEVNDYIPGSSGNTPINTLAMTTSNQITNPQFALINFASPFTFTGTDPDPIQIGPGWYLEAAGTGTVTLTQVPLTSTTPTPSNASYALEIELSGWNSGTVFLRQRFAQNGVLWANEIVSTALTARVDGLNTTISASFYNSMGTLIATVLNPVTVDNAFNEYIDHATFPASTDTDTPPNTYIDYKIALPSTVDIYITSVQVIVEDMPVNPAFEQDSIERQIDHTFHYYQPQINFKPIPSMLVGWDFPLNPAQPLGPSVTMNTTSAYIWDQTIGQSVVGNIAVVRNAVTGGFQATTANPAEAFYVMQYLSGAQAKKILGTSLSVNLNAFRTQAGGTVTARVYLYRGSAAAVFPTLPLTVGGATPLSAGGVFTLNTSAGQGLNWTLIPRGNWGQASGTLSTVNTGDYSTLNDATDLQFQGWEITDATQISDTDKFLIVVTFQCPTTGSVIVINSISVVPGDIPTRPAPQTADEVIRECERYFEMSFNIGSVPGTAVTDAGSILQTLTTTVGGGTTNAYATPFTINFNSYKLSPTSTAIKFYSVINTGAVNTMRAGIYTAGSGIIGSGEVTASTFYNTLYIGQSSVTPTGANNSAITTAASGAVSNAGFVQFHYTASSRIGIEVLS
jgi:hypothetical protein